METNERRPDDTAGKPEPARRVDVLLADDDEDIRDALIDTLEYAGYTAVAFSNGQDALDWLRSAGQLPSLILVDMMMPVLDGVQFREQQRGDPAIAAVPVAILSARGDILRSPGTEHLKKPIDAEELIAFVARHCGARDSVG